NEVIKKKENKAYPIRPVILGGDDLTVIIRADLAFDFTKTFWGKFEEESQKQLKFLKQDFQINGFEKGITACAGIAYVQESYPFHYAVDMAEILCGKAKDFVKKTVGYEGFVPQSALSFFKVQDSFIESKWTEIKNRVLKAEGELSFDYGPYLLHDNDKYAGVGELDKKLKVVRGFAKDKEENKANGVSKLRHWVSEAIKNKETADFMLERMQTVNGNFMKEIEKSGCVINEGKSIIYDVIQLYSFKK